MTVTHHQGAKHYEPIGTVYHVEFVDDHGYSWRHVVAVPYGSDVEEVLKILRKAYPGHKIKSLKAGDCIYHGYINRQVYE